MESLSRIFFCTAPFALFCSENGNGLILCPVFIILGFICKWIGNININIFKTRRELTEEEKAKMYEFWMLNYKDYIRSAIARRDSVNDGIIALADEEARRWATTMCGYHNANVPSEAFQELFARENGFITKKMIKERNKKKDRIQIGKYFLMRELKFKYEKKWLMKKEIEKDILKIKTSRHNGADDWYVKQEYGKTVSEMWETLSLEEKQQAENWIKEYEEKLIQAVHNYEAYNEYMIRPVKMDF